jgi:hypothetical protein
VVDPDIWLSLLLAIPLAVAGNLATRPVQNVLDKWGRTAPTRRLKVIRARIAYLKGIQANPQSAFIDMAVASIFCIVMTIVTVGLLVTQAVRHPPGEIWRAYVELLRLNWSMDHVVLVFPNFACLVAIITIMGLLNHAVSLGRAIQQINELSALEARSTELERLRENG